MSVEIRKQGEVYVNGRWQATFADRALAESYAEAKRAEITKAQPYYVDGASVWHPAEATAAVYVRRSHMPNGTPDRWQAELLAYCCDWLNAKWREVQG